MPRVQGTWGNTVKHVKLTCLFFYVDEHTAGVGWCGWWNIWFHQPNLNNSKFLEKGKYGTHWIC